MNLIPNYQNLNVLERIIFWGKIVVILLVIILLIIVIMKKRKKRQNDTINNDCEELPIIKEQIEVEETPVEEELLIKEEIELEKKESNQNDQLNLLEDDYVEDVSKVEEETKEPEPIANKYSVNFERPSAPYQKNVLREMSLSQTSPIGINKKEEKTVRIEEFVPNYEGNITIKEPSEELIVDIEDNDPIEKTNDEIVYSNNKQLEDVKYKDESLNEKNIVVEEMIEEQLENELEEDDIERTSYEIEQEENAIISYKELMEKKDSIKTIDEEEAIISIEELLNKTNNKKESIEENKLYNITEEEANDSFINELKQFRKDL